MSCPYERMRRLAAGEMWLRSCHDPSTPRTVAQKPRERNNRFAPVPPAAGRRDDNVWKVSALQFSVAGRWEAQLGFFVGPMKDGLPDAIHRFGSFAACLG